MMARIGATFWSATSLNQNKYVKEALKTFATGSHVPDKPEDVLLQLMLLYSKTAKEDYIQWLNHKADANECITILQDKKSETPVLSRVFAHIKTIAQIKPDGDFALIFNIFFTIYPHLRPSDNEALNKAQKQLPIWKEAVNARLDRYTKTDSALLPPSIHYLDQLGGMLPESRMVDHENNLVASLRSQWAESTVLHRGMIYLAIANLRMKRSASQNDKATLATLQADLEKIKSPGNISIIGLAAAIKAFNGNEEYTAELLFAYVLKNIDDLLLQVNTKGYPYCEQNEFAKSNYILKLFRDLELFTSHYSASQRISLMTLLIDDYSRIYQLRDHLGILRDWFSEDQLHVLEKIVKSHPNQAELSLRFHDWLGNRNYMERKKTRDVFIEDNSQDRQAFDTVINNLKQVFKESDPVKLWVEFALRFEGKKSISNEIIDNFKANIVIEHEPSADEITLRETLSKKLEPIYDAIPVLATASCLTQSKENRAAFAEAILKSVKCTTNVICAKGVIAAVAVDPDICKSNFKYYRDLLFNCLDSSNYMSLYPSCIAALSVYAAHADVNELPETMAALIQINNFQSFAALVEIEKIYEQRAPRCDIKAETTAPKMTV